MNQYIWEYVGPVSDNWHNKGAVLVVAATLEAARAKWAEGRPTAWADALNDEPDHTWPVQAEEIVLVFEDAGCC